jgi:ABC-type sugar transport system permease subunit
MASGTVLQSDGESNFLGFLLVFPAEAILLIFLAYPFILGLWLGFTDTVVVGKVSLLAGKLRGAFKKIRPSG